MVDLITAPDARLHVSVGKMPQPYIDAFDLPDDAKKYPTTRGFVVAFVTSALRRRTAVVFPPGPYPLTSWRSAGRGVLAITMSLLARTTGGASVTVGKSVRGRHRGARAVEKVLIRISNIYVARDRLSAISVGVPITAAPDLALLASPSDSSTRRFVPLSFRSDRPLDVEFLRAVVDWARTESLVPVFVTQVARDGARHAEHAAELGVDHLEWGAKSHRQQLMDITALYSESSLVVTDRLHAALLGVLGGAVPVAVRQGDSPSKIADALDGVMPYATLDREDRSDVVESLHAATSLRGAVVAGRTAARARLLEIQRDVRLATGLRYLQPPATATPPHRVG
ncbi:polysaccharide pyruvyl transferase family protein [Microbacterium sp. VKM Ac-2923]|nr:polysaccharide pyruvyl transferase family protein [Microbacterium sp. VKM Ac-2923]